MESQNLHQHHQLQQQIVGLSSLATQSSCGVSTFNDWSPSIIPNVSDYNTYMTEILPNSSREYLGPKNANLISPVKTSTIQSFAHQSTNTLQFSDMNIHNQLYILDLGEASPIEPYSYGGQTNGLQIQAREVYTNGESSSMFRGLASSSSFSFGLDHPSTNVSNVALCSSSSLGLDLGLDLLTSTNSTAGGSCSQSSHDSFGFFGEDMSLGQVHVEESSDNPSNSSNKESTFKKEVARTKRLSSSSEPKPSHEAAKKSRLMSLSPCPPFKVRKEKLGDRVAALHRLVAPFGKTDTASVLTEAIGYIQFLQNQIQKLTVPYMNSSCNSHCRTIQGSPNMEDGEEESKQELSSRGLCLAPLSFTSYISAYN